MNTSLEFLFQTSPPWISVGSGEIERLKWIPSYFYSRNGVNSCVRRLRGNKMRTQQALMDEFSASFQFFEGFGENWYALKDCLYYLDEWLPADVYTLVIEKAEEVLQNDDPEQMIWFLKTLDECGEWWSQPIIDNGRFNRVAIPFQVLFNVTDAQSFAKDTICQTAKSANVPIRWLS